MADQRFLELLKSGSISEITKYMKSSFNDVIKADPHKYTELCQVMANNQNLSTANTLLVYLQDPHAKLVSDIFDMATFGRKLTNTKEIALYTNKSINYAYDLGIRNAFIQEGSSQSDSFIPSFKGDMII